MEEVVQGGNAVEHLESSEIEPWGISIVEAAETRSQLSRGDAFGERNPWKFSIMKTSLGGRKTLRVRKTLDLIGRIYMVIRFKSLTDK